MAGKGPALKSGEVDGVYEGILNVAKLQRSRTVFISHEDLAPLLIGDEEWKKNTGDPDQDKNNIRRRNNRIRWKMQQKLAGMGIVARFKDSGYEFTISENTPINMSVEEESVVYESQRECDTFTPYKTPFHPPKHFPDLLKSLKIGLNPIQVGPKGCGKSRSFEEAGAILGIPQIRIALGSVHDPADLIGTKEVVNEGGVPITRFIPGLLVEAAKEGQMIILDEFDSVQPQVALALNMVLEGNSKMTCLTEQGVEVVERHPNTRIVATANTWGYGDGGMLYAGTELGNRATWDRFAPAFQVDYDHAVEKAIVSQWLHPNVTRLLYNEPKSTDDNKRGIIPIIREAIRNKEINDHLSVRCLERFAQFYESFGWHKGLELFIVRSVNPQYREVIRQKIRMSLGNEFVPSDNDYNENSGDYIPTFEKKIMAMGSKFEGVCLPRR